MPPQLTQIFGTTEDLPATACNTLEDVIAVAVTFAECGLFDRRYQWRSADRLI